SKWYRSFDIEVTTSDGRTGCQSPRPEYAGRAVARSKGVYGRKICCPEERTREEGEKRPSLRGHLRPFRLHPAEVPTQHPSRSGSRNRVGGTAPPLRCGPADPRRRRRPDRGVCDL